MSLPDRLLNALRPWLDAPAWRVAFSGGLDSTVLLDLLDTLRAETRLPPVSAVHVNHRLQPSSAAWAEHCAGFCERRGFPLRLCQVVVGNGASLEAAARAARYEAFEAELRAGEVLLTAHHRDDQAETLLFRLLRGAGVKGLAAMAPARPLGAGSLVRPLLGVGRDELEAWAISRGLSWVEDPSNLDVRYARNALRQEVFPLLRTHWSQAPASLARAAQNMREAQQLLDELAGLDLERVAASTPFPWLPLPSLNLEALIELSNARQRNLLRHWLDAYTAMPDAAHWHGWTCLRDACGAGEPSWRVQGGEVRRGGPRIWFVPDSWLAEPNAPPVRVEHQVPLALPGNGLVRLAGAKQLDELRVGYRRGGERLYVPGRGHRDLKRLLNESGLPPFVRGRLPLLFCGDRLVAVANFPALSEGGATLVWDPPGLS